MGTESQTVVLDLYLNRGLVGPVVSRPFAEGQTWGQSSFLLWGGERSEFESFSWIKVFHLLPCQAPGAVGSGLGPVGPVSVYCAWVSRSQQHANVSQRWIFSDNFPCCYTETEVADKPSFTPVTRY